MLKVIAAVTFCTHLLTGFKTMKGVGKHVPSTGHAVTGSASELPY